MGDPFSIKRCKLNIITVRIFFWRLFRVSFINLDITGNLEANL
jgi:hypothetical protein